MMCNVLVSAEYYVNYSDTDVPQWKPKGGVEFVFPVDSELIRYAPAGVLETALASMVAAHSDVYYRYEYFSHEVKFTQPRVVEGLSKELNTLCYKP